MERDWQVAGFSASSIVVPVRCTGARSPATAHVLAPRRGKGHDLSRIAEIATLPIIIYIMKLCQAQVYLASSGSLLQRGRRSVGPQLKRDECCVFDRTV